MFLSKKNFLYYEMMVIPIKVLKFNNYFVYQPKIKIFLCAKTQYALSHDKDVFTEASFGLSNLSHL